MRLFLLVVLSITAFVATMIINRTDANVPGASTAPVASGSCIPVALG